MKLDLEFCNDVYYSAFRYVSLNEIKLADIIQDLAKIEPITSYCRHLRMSIEACQYTKMCMHGTGASWFRLGKFPSQCIQLKNC